jgi:hypothetical protein|tara:strand:+ start:356 stop:811 length:456 start_codon:yes stop_codon:yes gene_type:complete
MTNKIKTPCIGICSTVFGDEVCRGCKRFQHEVIKWNAYSDNEKNIVWKRLESLKVQIMKSKVIINDVRLLKSSLDHYRINHYDQVDPYCWVFDLLKQASETIPDVSKFGIRIIQEGFIDLPSLKETIEGELFTLSEAHYLRYFKRESHYRT